ncbi:hypothetical protein BLS_001956 [Venturia inaequalis]|uniref:F-box domain-containing protein n=1 Tax=Venturia inaequalis TaxID=5025 RepID=A0A8H3UWC2_VENIN|nr:hypothetical protein EG328_006157 [Venturia inaequalis]KAE9977864.1 hypothetical protein EG327_007572 [Venturia inaequalis]KAE9984581.1 hypothetical protein BLS_001956 [Venturia inaequalis]
MPGNRAMINVPNELWDAIFVDNMTKRELLSLSITSRIFRKSAQKALFCNVTLTAATEGNIKTFCIFLKTILTNPGLAAHVKHLDVAFIAKKFGSPEWTIDRPRPNRAFYNKTDAHDVIAPYRSLFSTRLQKLAPEFELHDEQRYWVIYNMLFAVMLSVLPTLQALTVDYVGFNTTTERSAQFCALSNTFAQGLNNLRSLSVRNLEVIHEILNLNLLQHLVALPSMRNLCAVTYLPLLPTTCETTALTSLEVRTSHWISSNESYKLTELLNASPAINRVTLTVPVGQQLIGRGAYSTILNPIAKSLRTLTVDYDMKGEPKHWDRGHWGWPQFLSLATFPILTHLDISWHFFFNHFKSSNTSHTEHTFMVKHLPSVLENLTIYDIAITVPDESLPNSGFCEVSNHGQAGCFIPVQSEFLGHLQRLGVAHRTGVLDRLGEVTLKTILVENLSVEKHEYGICVYDSSSVHKSPKANESVRRFLPFYNTCAAYLPELLDGFVITVDGVSVNP